MAHEIFISYSSKHRELTRQLVAVIEGQYGPASVWWDHALESRGSYAEQIKAALEKARVVVVVWTAGAMISDYVYAEAVRAMDAGKLVNVRPSDIAFQGIPEPFNIFHIDEAADHARILASIASVMAGRPVPTRVPLHELYYRQHGHRLIDPKRRLLARDALELSPTELLQARYEVVPFVDATGAKRALLDWCMSARPRAGRLLHGPGGLGKTRLLIDVASALRDKEWTAGFLERPHERVESTLKQRSQALDQLIDHGVNSGLLIVMDYAEGRQDEIRALAERLGKSAENLGGPIRLVLLSRGAGDWWTTLADETPEIERLFRREGTRAADVMALPAITSGEQRLALFVKSVEALAPLMHAQGFALQTNQPDIARLQRIESGEANTRPLAIQMEALLYLASAAPDSEARGVDDLLRKVLGIERDHWRKLIGPLDEDRMRDLSRAVAQITAVQGVNGGASAERLLMSDEFYQGQRTARVTIEPVLRGLSRVYGRSDGGIAHLEPDLIGEHQVAMLADFELIEGCLHWIDCEPEAEQEKRRRDLLTVLQRATQPEHGVRAVQRATHLLDYFIVHYGEAWSSDIVAVAIDTPGALANRLELLAPNLDARTIETFYWLMPDRSLKLDAAAVALARERTKRSEEVPSPSRRAEQMLNLGYRLSNHGRHEEALSVTQDALAIYLSLAKDRPDEFLPLLAKSKTNIGWALSKLGRQDGALSATQEAIDIYRPLARECPDAFLPDLAFGSANLGIYLSSLGRHEEALIATQEAVNTYRAIAKDRPDLFLSKLAGSLSNLSDTLSSLGRHEAALAATQEALDIRRRLVDDRPDTYLPSLGRSLTNLGWTLYNLGRYLTSLAASQEALAIYRELAQNRPETYKPDLARTLNGLACCLSALERCKEALEASREATEIRLSLAGDRPQPFLYQVADSLSTTADILVALGRRQEADAAAREALAILEPLLEQDANARRIAEHLRKKLLQIAAEGL